MVIFLFFFFLKFGEEFLRVLGVNRGIVFSVLIIFIFMELVALRLKCATVSRVNSVCIFLLLSLETWIVCNSIFVVFWGMSAMCTKVFFQNLFFNSAFSLFIAPCEANKNCGPKIIVKR